MRDNFWLTIEAATRSGSMYCLCQKQVFAPVSFGQLHPLPIPFPPWSHIAVDFFTGLPPSKGNTVRIYHFSISAYFFILPKLPSALETDNFLVQHVFRLHGIPQEIFSNRGPQFILQVWKGFCEAMGTSVSLASGFHPQTNGQTERMIYRQLLNA